MLFFRLIVKITRLEQTLRILNITYRTAPNIAARVSKVVIAIVTRPGIDSGGKNSDNQATITKRPLGRYV